MEFTYIDAIGIVAGFLIVCSFVPQLIMIIKNKSAKDISVTMYIVLLIAQVLWMVYGVLKRDFQVIVTNAVTTFLTILIIIFALWYSKNKNTIISS
jgi:MtN3 and saliva related transmembrane protein